VFHPPFDLGAFHGRWEAESFVGYPSVRGDAMGTAPRPRPSCRPSRPRPSLPPNRCCTVPRSPDPTVPTVQIHGFDQLELIGKGGFSYVFSARQRDFNRRVALKVLTFGLVDERERRSFERECRAMGLVSQHPHIVTVFNAAFTASKQPVIVMELYSGGTMGDRQKREGRLPVAAVLDTGVKIAGALQTAHDRGLLHRDIKPQNLFISEFGEPALGDFGISTLDDERSISGGGGLTVHYAPPEVLEGAKATAISDVYSFAATLYTLLEGARPFAPTRGSRQPIADLARRIMLEPPPRMRRDDAPRGLSELLARTMSKSPDERPVSAAAFGRELQRIQGELGLPVTALPLAAPPPALAPAPSAPEQGPPVAPVEAPASLPPPASSAHRGSASGEVERSQRARQAEGRDIEVEIRAVDAEGVDADGHTITVGRPAVPADEASDTRTGAAVSEASTRRIVIGTAAGVVCLLAVAASLLVFGRGGGGRGDETTVPGPTTTQDLGLPPPRPQGVTVTRGAGDGEQVVVAWQAVGEPDSGITYQVRQQNPSGPVRNTDALSVTIDGVSPAARPCFVVIAITAAGQTSNESELACLLP
jgi:serine/threonine protein kinase